MPPPVPTLTVQPSTAVVGDTVPLLTVLLEDFPDAPSLVSNRFIRRSLPSSSACVSFHLNELAYLTF